MIPLQAVGLSTGLTMVVLGIGLVYLVDELDLAERINSTRAVQIGGFSLGFLMAPQITGVLTVAGAGLAGVGTVNLLGIATISFEQALAIGIAVMAVWYVARTSDMDLIGS